MNTGPVSHIDLAVSDRETSLAFYRDLLRPLGYVRESEIVGERGEQVTYLEPARDGGAVGIRQRRSGEDTVKYDRYATGLHHLAFAASSRDVVDAQWRWLVEHNIEIEAEPREYDYAPGYYAVFFYDPDGIKLEIVHLPE